MKLETVQSRHCRCFCIPLESVSMSSGACAGPHAGWRWPFVIVAFPAILASFLMILTTREPERGATEDALKVHALSYPFLLSLHTLHLSYRDTAAHSGMKMF